MARQHQRFFIGKNILTDPRTKMLEDLTKEAEQWANEGDLLVIGIDSNEDVRSTEMKKFCDRLGLVNAILDRHKDKSPPATYNRNQKREPIDAIWILAALQVSGAGFLGFDCALPSDHRALWVDIPYEEALGYAFAPMDCGSRRKLNSRDPRLVKKYCQRTKALLQKEDIPGRLCRIELHARCNGWNEVLEDEYNYLHRRNLQIHKQVESKLRTFRAGAVPWSPKLQGFRDEILLWTMILKKRQGIKTSTKKIQRLMKKIGKHDALQLQQEEAAQNVDQAFREYKIAKSQAPLWRDDFLHNLAAAHAKANGTNKKSELKALTQVKRQKRQAASIKRVWKKIQDLACYKIQVGDGEEERTVDTKLQIKKAFVEANLRKFGQTANTPPRQDTIRNLLGEHGETCTVESILNGTYVPDDGMDPLLAEFLLTLKRPETATAAIPNNEGISTQTHIEGWKKQKEAISAEATRLTFSHYKAAIQDPLLADVDAIFRSLPFQYGFAPEEWMTITDVQILKKAGIYHVDKMRTIMLMHAEFNMNNKLIGKIMMEFAERFYLLAIEQFGSRQDHQVVAAALNKRLTFDILRQKRLAGAICANGAKSCYDRIVHNIAAICMMRAGAPREAVWSMFKMLKNSVHHIKTAFGVSNVSYTADHNNDLQGIGQGNGCGPAAWAAISTPIIHLMKRRNHGLKFVSALSNMITEFVAYAFVDDTDLVMSAHDTLEEAVVTLQGLQDFATDWDEALYLTGGAIVPEKSHWTMISMAWENDKWRYQTKDQLSGDIKLKDPISRIPKPIKRLDPHEAEETLGVYLAGDGNNKKQIQKLRNKSQIFTQCIKTGRISKYDMNSALRTTMMKTLEYPILATNINEGNWVKILSPAVRSALPRMGFVRTLPKEIVHGPKCLGGLEIQDLWNLQHIRQIQYCLEEMNHKSIAKNLIVTSAEQFVLEAGLNIRSTDHLLKIVSKYTTDCWWKSLMTYCFQHGFKINTNIKLPLLVCSNDSFIMEEIIKSSWTPKELCIINECRMALKVVRVSDIVLADGRNISPWAWSGEGTLCQNKLNWPKLAVLTRRHWNLWRKALGISLLNNDIARQSLRHPLNGRRIAVLQQTYYRFWVFSRSRNRLYLYHEHHWVLFLLSATHNRRRTQRQYFKRTDEVIEDPPNPLEFASVAGSFDDEIVILIGSDPNTVNKSLEAPNRKDFAANLSDIIKKDPWLWEDVQGFEHAEIFVNALQEGNLNAISDGSYMDGFGTSASVLCTTDGTEGWIRSITPGDSKYQHSQRSELAGIAASLGVVDALCRTYDINCGQVVVGLDGQQAINNVQRQRPRIKFSDYDMIIFIKDQIERLPVTVEFHWIKGHQDDFLQWHELDFYAQMNVKADKVAKSFLISNIQSQVPQPLVIFSTDNWCLVRNGIKYANVASDLLYEDVMQDRLIQYWIKRGDIPQEEAKDIDWDNFGLAFLNCSFAQRRRIIKLSSSHAPVG